MHCWCAARVIDNCFRIQRKEKKEYKEHILALVWVFGRLTKDTLELFLNYDRAKKLHECLGVTNTAREVSAIAVQLQTLKNNILVQRKVLKMCGQRQENLNRMVTIRCDPLFIVLVVLI